MSPGLVPALTLPLIAHVILKEDGGAIPRPSEGPMYFARHKTYYVYILTNRSRTLYTGVTSNLEQRVWQHKHHVFPGFTAQYKLDRLVYFERFSSVHSAIAREKQIKGYTRLKKTALIVGQNPTWKDLSDGWYVKHRFEPDHAA